MRFEIQLGKLKEIFSLTERVAGKHATLPVLACVLVEVKKNEAVFKATNLDVGIEVTAPAKASEEGTMAIPAHIVVPFISQISNQNQVVTLETQNNSVQITSAKTKGAIKTFPAEDFPSIPRIEDGKKLILPTEVLIKGLKSVWYSSSLSNVKPELSSVYVYKDGENLVFAATDSFRLAEKRIKSPQNTDFHEILVPFRNVSDIIRVLENIGDKVELTISKNMISFENDGIYMVSRVIDGVFPDYRQIVPKSYSTEVVVLKEDFWNALKVSNIFSDKFNQIHLSIDPKKKLFEVQTKNSDVGENKTFVDGALTGDQMEINFNYKYIVDCFQSIDADSVSLQLSGLNRPMVIRPVSGDQSFMYLVMPMNR